MLPDEVTVDVFHPLPHDALVALQLTDKNFGEIVAENSEILARPVIFRLDCRYDTELFNYLECPRIRNPAFSLIVEALGICKPVLVDRRLGPYDPDQFERGLAAVAPVVGNYLIGDAQIDQQWLDSLFLKRFMEYIPTLKYTPSLTLGKPSIHCEERPLSRGWLEYHLEHFTQLKSLDVQSVKDYSPVKGSVDWKFLRKASIRKLAYLRFQTPLRGKTGTSSSSDSSFDDDDDSSNDDEVATGVQTSENAEEKANETGEAESDNSGDQKAAVKERDGKADDADSEKQLVDEVCEINAGTWNLPVGPQLRDASSEDEIFDFIFDFTKLNGHEKRHATFDNWNFSASFADRVLQAVKACSRSVTVEFSIWYNYHFDEEAYDIHRWKDEDLELQDKVRYKSHDSKLVIIVNGPFWFVTNDPALAEEESPEEREFTEEDEESEEEAGG